MVSLKHRQRLFNLNLGIILTQLFNLRLLVWLWPFFLGLWGGGGLREWSCMQKVNSPGSYLLSVHSSRQSIRYYIPLIQSSITSSMLELPFPKLARNGKSSIRESTQLRKTFTSPVVDQYEKVAAKYRNYINELTPKIEVVYEKENFRNYLNQQKLNVIKSQLLNKKEVLQRQLEDKMDPAKSPNGKLHTEIISLTELEANYSAILADIEKSAGEKEREIATLGQMVRRQKEVIKRLLKCDFKHSKENNAYKLPKIYRNASEASFLSRDNKSVYRHSRESIISKLSSSIISRTNDRVNSEEERIIMLKLFLVYAHSESEQNELSSKLMEALEKELAVREGVVKEIKAELSEIQAETRANMSINME